MFLALGMADPRRAIASRAVLVVVALVAVKLAAEPLLALLFVRVLGRRHRRVWVVLQAAMPSALASVIVAARVGADRSLSAGIAALSTLLLGHAAGHRVRPRGAGGDRVRT